MFLADTLAARHAGGRTPHTSLRFTERWTDSPRVHLAISAPSEVIEDGTPLIRNISDQVIAFVENGPLYGPFSVEVPDTVNVLDQSVLFLADTRVRAAALSSDGSRTAYVDDRGRLFTISTTTASASPDEIIDLRRFLGPIAVSSIQWAIGSPDVLLIRLERELGLEAWTVLTLTRQLGPAGVDPGSIGEPGSEHFDEVNLFTRSITAGLWRVPAPERFER